MAEYSLEFGERLATIAGEVAHDDLDTLDAKRTVLYLSCLSAEISLKALLEKAGWTVEAITKRNHSLSKLLRGVCECLIDIEVTTGNKKRVSASRLRSVTLDAGYANATIGTLLDTESLEASKYPNQVRYGDRLCHYPPELFAKMATALVLWARQHWDDICLEPIHVTGADSAP